MKRLLVGLGLMLLAPAGTVVAAEAVKSDSYAEQALEAFARQKFSRKVSQFATRDVLELLHTEMFARPEDLTLFDCKVLLTLAPNAVTWIDTDELKNTLLHTLAPFIQDPHIIRFLVNNGASLTAINTDGQTPEELAKMCENEAMVQVCIELQKQAPYRQHFDAMMFVVEAMEDLNRAFDRYYDEFLKKPFTHTVLLYLIRASNRPVIQPHIEQVKAMTLASPEQIDLQQLSNLFAFVPEECRAWKTAQGDTLLHLLAPFCDDRELILFLLKQGASCEERNNDGQTPCDIANACCNKPFLEVLTQWDEQPQENDFDPLRCMIEANMQADPHLEEKLAKNPELARQLEEKILTLDPEEQEKLVMELIKQEMFQGEILPLVVLQNTVASMPDFAIIRDDATGNTYLHRLAMVCRDKEVLRFMLSLAQVDLEATNNAGFTVRQVAENAENEVLLDLLEETNFTK